MPDHLAELLIENATDSGRDVRPGRAQRSDGWTADRIRTFLSVLARQGSVIDASRAAGISPKSAYALRNSTKGEAFARAWDAALSLERQRVQRQSHSAGSEPFAAPIFRNGKLVGMRHDNRGLIAALTRLDRLTTAHGADR